MKNTKRKGFTIVELVIVIAVIAILAAVLIPTFASLINKANRSADIQAVHQMNTALAVDEATSNKTIFDVYDALEELGLTAKDYKPLSSDTYFFWDAKENRIVYTDDKYVVTYPNNLTDATYANGWYSLSGEIKKEDVTISEDGTATVSNAGQLYSLSESTPQGLKTIKLTQSINLMGANISFVVEENDSLTITADSAVTISGLCTVGSAYTETQGEAAGREYACGLIGRAKSGATVTLNNITIANAVIGDLEVGSVGAFVGLAEKTTIQITKCFVKNSTIYGKNKVGGVVGSMSGSTLTIDADSKMERVTMYCSEGESALLIGCAWSYSTVNLGNGYTSQIANCTMSLVNGAKSRDTKTEQIEYEVNGSKSAAAVTLVQKGDKTSEYRMHVDGALITVINATVKIGNTSYEYGDTIKATPDFGAWVLRVFK